MALSCARRRAEYRQYQGGGDARIFRSACCRGGLKAKAGHFFFHLRSFSLRMRRSAINDDCALARPLVSSSTSRSRRRVQQFLQIILTYMASPAAATRASYFEISAMHHRHSSTAPRSAPSYAKNRGRARFARGGDAEVIGAPCRR